MRPNTALAPRLRSGPDAAAFDKLRPRACQGEPLDFPRPATSSAERDGEPFDVSQGREPVERRVDSSQAEGLEGPRNWFRVGAHNWTSPGFERMKRLGDV